VLYLVHGAGDSDDSWTSVGHAHYILDNLIASGKAKPMIVVMPFGHTPDRAGADMLVNEDFGNDLAKDLMPFVEASFRTRNGPATRAMAGRSMGGAHTLGKQLKLVYYAVGKDDFLYRSIAPTRSLLEKSA